MEKEDMHIVFAAGMAIVMLIACSAGRKKNDADVELPAAELKEIPEEQLEQIIE